MNTGVLVDRRYRDHDMGAWHVESPARIEVLERMLADDPPVPYLPIEPRRRDRRRAGLRPRARLHRPHPVDRGPDRAHGRRHGRRPEDVGDGASRRRRLPRVGRPRHGRDRPQRPRPRPPARPPRRGLAGHGLLLLQQRRDRRRASRPEARPEADPRRRLGPPPRQRHGAGVLRPAPTSSTSRPTRSPSSPAPGPSASSAAAKASATT